MFASWSCGCRRGVYTGPAPGAGRGAAAKRCRGVWGAGPLRWGEFERGIPLSCCRPGDALFIPYNSVLYKKERPHRPGTNPGGRSGANRPGFSRFAFCIRSSYTVGAPAAISRRNAPRVIKSARAGNAVDVVTGGRLRPAVRPGRSWRALRSWKLRPAGEDASQRRSGHRSEHLHKTGTETGHMAGASAGAIRGVHCRPEVLTVFRSCAVVALLPALYACRLLSLMVVEWGCGGLPPPGKGPSPAVWGEGLYRLPLGTPAASSSWRHLYWSRAKTA